MKYLINFVLPPDVVDNILTEMLPSTGVTEEELNRHLYMTEEQILDLYKRGHVIGAHSHRHIPLNRIENHFGSDIGTNIDTLLSESMAGRTVLGKHCPSLVGVRFQL